MDGLCEFHVIIQYLRRAKNNAVLFVVLFKSRQRMLSPQGCGRKDQFETRIRRLLRTCAEMAFLGRIL